MARRKSPLSILPVSANGVDLAPSLSPEVVARLIEQVRQRYNTVLIDCGPATAHIEATMVASQVDGVLLTVSQGVHGRMVERTLSRLSAIGANIAGVVFNRAKNRDMAWYGSSSYSSMSVRSGTSGSDPGETEWSSQKSTPERFGPVASATARCLTTSYHGNGDGREE